MDLQYFILNWMIVGFMCGKNIPLWKILLISLVWETLEIAWDAARITDILLNMWGFLLGKHILTLINFN